MEEQLEIIGDILGSKFSSYMVFHSRESQFNIRFPNPLKLNQQRNYEMALQYFCVANHLVNIKEGNNKFIYSRKSKPPQSIFTTIVLETGANEIKQIVEEIKRQMIQNADWSEKRPPPLNIGVNLSTFKSYIEITDSDYMVLFNQPGTIRGLLGFNSKVIGLGYNISDTTVQITNTSAICLK